MEAETGTGRCRWYIDREHAPYVTSKLTHYDSINYGLLFEVADQGDPLAKRIVERNLTYWGA